jgi:sugar phosphate isomerase/epimerase
VLVNNAAFQVHTSRFEDLTARHFDETLKTNLYGYFYMAQAAVKHMKPGAAIVNTGSVTGLLGNEALLVYLRMEMLSETVMGKPIEQILALLKQYGLIVNHLWHSDPLYPAAAGEKTIATTIEVLERARPLKCTEFFFDPFDDRGPLSDDDARTQNRGLDRIGREAKDRGMNLCVHNHEGPMRNKAKEWLGVVNHTDPALVSMCLDLDWTLHAGTDPFPLLQLAGDNSRLGAIHMRTQHKLITDQTMENGGDIDFHKVADYLKKIRYDGPVVEETEWMRETKVTRSPRENKRIARIWCEKVFGVSAQA